MDRTDIAVPEFNDSFSRVQLDNRQFLIRFAYNDTCDFWTFGLYTPLREPIVQGIKIVPDFPLNLSFNNDDMPNGTFGVFTELERIGRADFWDGKATFAFVSDGEQL